MLFWVSILTEIILTALYIALNFMDVIMERLKAGGSELAKVKSESSTQGGWVVGQSPHLRLLAPMKRV